MKVTPYYEEGTEKRVACVFSCPGRYEEEAGRPAARMTGKNLDKVLSALNRLMGTDHFVRGRVRITNSWTNVEYDAKTGRSEATFAEIGGEENLRRLADELADIQESVLCFGARAAFAVEEVKKRGWLKDSLHVAVTIHPGMRGINTRSVDRFGEKILPASAFPDLSPEEKKQLQAENTRRRVETLAAELAEGLKNQKTE